MADQDSGGMAGRKLAGLPMWAWPVAAGAVLGLVWFLRRGSSTPAPVDQSGGGAGGTPDTQIMPIDQGLSENQFEELLAAIRALQGPPSTPLPPQGGGPQVITNPPKAPPPVDRTPPPPRMFYADRATDAVPHTKG